jgi:cysteine desulfurase
MQAYLDHAATTPLRPEARQAMLPWLGERFGNPSGSHAVARAARRAVDEARDEVAAALGCDSADVIFCSGGTEADNLAVTGAARKGAFDEAGGDRGTIVCTAVEHHAVLHPVEHLGGRIVAVDRTGTVDLDALADALDDGVRLVSVMAANNEVGTIQPLAEVAAIVRDRAPQAVLHTDAVQGFPWLDVAEVAADFDLITVTGHKCGGPQGAGVLVARPDVDLRPMFLGGGQERERRPGTHNVAGIVGLAAAMTATAAQRDHTVARVGALRDRLADGLVATAGATETVPRDRKVAGSCHVCLPGAESDALLFLLDQAGIAASAASACASGATDPSHVLAAMGLAPGQAAGALRLSLGWTTTDEEIDHALSVIPDAVGRLSPAAG